MLSSSTTDLRSEHEFAELAEKLIDHQLPTAQILELLLEVTPEKVSPAGFATFVAAARRTLSAEYAGFSDLAAHTFDCCGTGGSGRPHFNTSTTVAFVLAAAGVQVVKFGNRKATGQSGSFDLLDELGFSAQPTAAAAAEILADSGQVFLFAPHCYPALAHLSAARQTLKLRTIFNYIGPLLNPASPSRRLLGVSNSDMQACAAHYLAAGGSTQKAFVVRSANDVDELEPGVTNYLLHVEGTQQSTLEHAFQHLVGDTQPARPDLSASELTPARNKQLFEQIVAGRDGTSPYAALVRLNSAVSLFAAGAAESIEKGHELAGELLQCGAVQNQFNKVRTAYARHTQ